MEHETPRPSSWQRLRTGHPGRRFQDYCDGDRGAYPPTMWRRVGRWAIAITLIVLGIAIGWMPGPGGFIGLIGLAILSAEFPPIARMLDKLEMILRDAWRRMTTSE